MIADMIRRTSISRDFSTLIPETAFIAIVWTGWWKRKFLMERRVYVWDVVIQGKTHIPFLSWLFDPIRSIHNIFCCYRVCFIKMGSCSLGNRGSEFFSISHNFWPKSLGEAFIILYLLIVATVFRPGIQATTS